MKDHFVALDIEIVEPISDFRTWKQHRPLAISCIGLAPSWTQPYAVFPMTALSFNQLENPPCVSTSQIDCLANQLEQWIDEGIKIITWNGLSFDLPVLSDHTSFAFWNSLAFSDSHVDLMLNLWSKLGYRTALNSIAKGTLAQSKVGFASGAEAPVAWQEGRYDEVIDYCKMDAEITLKLFQHTGFYQWRTRRGVPKSLGTAKLKSGVKTTLDEETLSRPLVPVTDFLSSWRKM